MNIIIRPERQGTNIENVTQRKCTPKKERKCNTVYETKCKTLTRPKCYDEYKKVPYQEEECNAEYVRECPKVWEVQQGAKVWVPETEKCVTLVSFEKRTLFSNNFPYSVFLNLPEKDQMQTCYQVQE